MADQLSSHRPRVQRLSRARAAASAVALLLALSSPAGAEDLLVKYDQSQLLRLGRPAAEVIIGNPSIADVTIQSGNLLVVTGKSFGITNIIVLDAERNVIEERRVLVQRDVLKVVNLQKGGKRESYNCSPQCNPTITIGDDSQYFEMVANLSERKMKLSEGQAGGGTGSAGGGQ
ncbi:MAG: pilus assembly protein N-terminal domain-containing protein [Hyphomicrobiaceae bacterium]|nr:pilus assembly protein N-terminal domain-containing protein [Hyphomicrobiaceae bacterium]